jgi:uncharacterized LabA/DUF88 family protein
MQLTDDRRIALFLDFENLVTNTGINPSHFDLQPSLDRLLEKGKVVFRRAYCDWSRFRAATRRLHEVGVELIDVPPSTRAGKNGADMRLVIDALELCYAREHINTFVIASGDSDFCPLAYKLRENNKLVIGLAVKEATSPFFVKACDEFLYLRPATKTAARADEEREPEEESSRGRGGRRGRRSSERTESTSAPQKERAPKAAATEKSAEKPAKAPRQVPEIAREVVKSLLARATGPTNPSFLKEAIIRKQPDFDERDFGFSTFSRLLAEMENAGLLRREQQGRQWYVLPPDMATDAAEDLDDELDAPAAMAAVAAAPPSDLGEALEEESDEDDDEDLDEP